MALDPSKVPTFEQVLAECLQGGGSKWGRTDYVNVHWTNAHSAALLDGVKALRDEADALRAERDDCRAAINTNVETMKLLQSQRDEARAERDEQAENSIAEIKVSARRGQALREEEDRHAATRQQLAEAKDEVERLRAALRHYASIKSKRYQDADGNVYYQGDGGHRARAALAKIES
jgi:hypothetical protein